MGLVIGTNCGFVTVAPTDDPGLTTFIIESYAAANKHIAPTGAIKVTEIGWWCETIGPNANSDVGIYDHNSGDNNPENLLGSATISTGTETGWKRATGLNIPITAGNTYWIAIQCDNVGNGISVDFSNDGVTKLDYKGSGETALTDPWGVTGGTITYLQAAYAVYEVAAGTNMQINVGDVMKDIAAVQVNVGDVWKDIATASINIGDVWKTIF